MLTNQLGRIVNDKAPDKGGDGKTNPPPLDDDRPGLGGLERTGALIFGLAGVGTGGVGVFLSDNQAGTTAILLLGAVFLLMAVQGTAIRSASRDNVEMERRAKAKVTREMVKEAELALKEGETDRAEVLTEAAERLSSNAVQRLQGTILSQTYQQAVAEAIKGYAESRNRASALRFGLGDFGMDIQLDLSLKDRHAGVDFGVMVKYTHAPNRTLTSAVVRQAINIYTLTKQPLLIVGNFKLSRSAQLVMNEHGKDKVFFAEWHVDGSTDELYRAIDEIYARAGS